MDTTIELNIFSPRWGHEDLYTVELSQDCMKISMQAKKAKATWCEESDPKWTGESLEKIMNNDNIYPPAITKDLFERAWKAWRNGDLNAQDVAEELRHLANWINIITKSKPASEFWSKYL